MHGIKKRRHFKLFNISIYEIPTVTRNQSQPRPQTLRGKWFEEVDYMHANFPFQQVHPIIRKNKKEKARAFENRRPTLRQTSLRISFV